jgi:hypothetical protein
VLPLLVTLTALGVRGVVPDSWAVQQPDSAIGGLHEETMNASAMQVAIPCPMTDMLAVAPAHPCVHTGPVRHVVGVLVESSTRVVDPHPPTPPPPPCVSSPRSPQRLINGILSTGRRSSSRSRPRSRPTIALLSRYRVARASTPLPLRADLCMCSRRLIAACRGVCQQSRRKLSLSLSLSLAVSPTRTHTFALARALPQALGRHPDACFLFLSLTLDILPVQVTAIILTVMMVLSLASHSHHLVQAALVNAGVGLKHW